TFLFVRAEIPSGPVWLLPFFLYDFSFLGFSFFLHFLHFVPCILPPPPATSLLPGSWPKENLAESQVPRRQQPEPGSRDERRSLQKLLPYPAGTSRKGAGGSRLL